MKAVAAGTAVLAAGLLLAGCSPTAESQASNRPGVRHAGIAEVENREIPVVYQATGSVKARLNAVLSSKIAARIESVLVREGDAVAQGETVLRLDSRDISAEVLSAEANLRAAQAAVSNADTARTLENENDLEAVRRAQATVAETTAAERVAESKLDLALAGPRAEEKQTSVLALEQAQSTLTYAETQLKRIRALVQEGALAQNELDKAQNAFDVALSQRDTAQQSQKMALDGTRPEDVRAARDGVAQARAALEVAKANLAQARTARLEVRRREAESRIARAQLAQSSAALRSAQVACSYATISAPFSGRIVSRLADPGAIGNPGTPLLIEEGGGLRLEAVLPERFLPDVHVGQTLDVRFDGALGLNSRVDEITPQADPSTHTVVVKLALPASGLVRSGMFGRAAVPIGHRHALLVPGSAIFERQGLRYAFVLDADGRARLHVVTTGDATGDKIEVLSGLSSGEKVVSTSPKEIADGDRIETR